MSKLSSAFAKSPVVNEAGGVAIKLSPEATLIQYAFTGTFHSSFYVNYKMQLDVVLNLCEKIDSEMLAKIAIASRQYGYMKDMPAVLLACLHSKDSSLAARVFGKVIDSGKMLQKFIEAVSSGKCGRKSLGSTTKRAIQAWLDGRSYENLMFDNIGGLKKTLQRVHPKPSSKTREAMY